jgi:hypothetical protein
VEAPEFRGQSLLVHTAKLSAKTWISSLGFIFLYNLNKYIRKLPFQGELGIAREFPV